MHSGIYVLTPRVMDEERYQDQNSKSEAVVDGTRVTFIFIAVTGYSFSSFSFTFFVLYGNHLTATLAVNYLATISIITRIVPIPLQKKEKIIYETFTPFILPTRW